MHMMHRHGNKSIDGLVLVQIKVQAHLYKNEHDIKTLRSSKIMIIIAQRSGVSLQKFPETFLSDKSYNSPIVRTLTKLGLENDIEKICDFLIN